MGEYLYVYEATIIRLDSTVFFRRRERSVNVRSLMLKATSVLANCIRRSLYTYPPDDDKGHTHGPHSSTSEPPNNQEQHIHQHTQEYEVGHTAAVELPQDVHTQRGAQGGEGEVTYKPCPGTQPHQQASGEQRERDKDPLVYRRQETCPEYVVRVASFPHT